MIESKEGRDRVAEVEVTQLLQSIREGDEAASDRLLALIYQELRSMAGARMRLERPGHTLQPTALVNEAYLRLAGGAQQWENRAHFFGAAARAMRRILVDHARKRASQKRGSGAARITFDEMNIEGEDPDLDLLALDEALTALAKHDDRLAEVVRLRYFAGLSIQETAEVMDTSPATVKRDWSYARAWLFERMS